MLEQVLMTASIIPIFIILISSIGSVAATSVSLEKISTGSNSLDHRISDFYKCITDTHKDPPSISVTNQCYFDNVQNGNTNPSVNDNNDFGAFSSSLQFHHFSEQPHSEIINNHHHGHFPHHHTIIIEGFNH